MISAFAVIARQHRALPFGVRRNRGVGFLEVMLGAALAAILMAIAIPTYSSYMNRSKTQQAVADLQAIEQLLSQYEVLSEHGDLPDSLDDMGAAIPLDPWGNPYQFLNIATTHGNGQLRKDRNLVPINSDYDLYSMGPDGRSVSPLTSALSRDDIVRAGNGAFVGVAADYAP